MPSILLEASYYIRWKDSWVHSVLKLCIIRPYVFGSTSQFTKQFFHWFSPNADLIKSSHRNVKVLSAWSARPYESRGWTAVQKPYWALTPPGMFTSSPHFSYLKMRAVMIILGFSGGPVVKNPPANARNMGSIPRSRRTPEEGNGNWLHSCLGNPRGAWAEKPGVLQSTGLQKG